VFAADNVIDLMRKTGAVLMYQTAFAPSPCPFNDQTARDLIYFMSHWRGSAARAFATRRMCSRSMK
jgi:hypothetical protein